MKHERFPKKSMGARKHRDGVVSSDADENAAGVIPAEAALIEAFLGQAIAELFKAPKRQG